MPKYVNPEKFQGDWYNRGRGRVVKCKACGHEFTAYIRIKTAICPRGHRMMLLSGRENSRSFAGRGANSGPSRVVAHRSVKGAVQAVLELNP